jgi:hypothetical protein
MTWRFLSVAALAMLAYVALVVFSGATVLL